MDTSAYLSFGMNIWGEGWPRPKNSRITCKCLSAFQQANAHVLLSPFHNQSIKNIYNVFSFSVFTIFNAICAAKRIRRIMVFSVFHCAIFTLIKRTIVAFPQFIVTYQLIAYSAKSDVIITNRVVALLASFYIFASGYAYVFFTNNAYFFCRWHSPFALSSVAPY